MPETCDKIKSLLTDLQGRDLSSTAKLVAIVEACGITDRAEIEALVECGSSTLRTAKAALKNKRSKSSAARNQALENEQTARNQAQTLENERSKSSVPSRAHATKESPTEISVTKKDKINTMSETDVSDHTHEYTPKARRRFSYTYDFEQFWKAYPVIGNSSKVEAYKEWRKLDSGERSNAQDGLRHLAEHCRKNPTYTCLHACRYLSQRRWESYQTVAERLGAEVVQIASYKPMPQPRRELSQAELEAMVLADEAMEAARV